MTRETSEALAVAAAYLYVRRIEDYPHTTGAGEILDLGSGLYVHGHDTIADLAARIAEALPGAEDALRENLRLSAADAPALYVFSRHADGATRHTPLVDLHRVGVGVGGRSVVEVFGDWVGRSPGAVAVVGEGVRWSFAELDRRAWVLAG
ncbi:hypothetical protein ACFVVU_32185, partial [Kitasatospora sp. NPDC057965]|uniref:hypothetical protein n=1 Tax=Kitasatospora sp. NPDC057965 TaxID=3346291 RepID=UPI0036DCC218